MPELAEELAPADDDERLEQAEGIVRDFCGWHIAPSRTDTVTFRNVQQRLPLMLPSLYVTAIVSVTDQGTLVDPSVYDFTSEGILSRIDGSYWECGTGVVTVVFTHGYDPVPPSVTRAVQNLASVLPNGLKSKAAGPFSESYYDDIPPGDKSTLGKYRIPVGP